MVISKEDVLALNASVVLFDSLAFSVCCEGVLMTTQCTLTQFGGVL